MVASAGIRTIKPIIRFADEFASLGSNPTPHHAIGVKGIALYGEHREDNGVMNALLLPTGPFGKRELATFAYAHSTVAFAEEPTTTPEEALQFYRIQFYNGFHEHELVSDPRYLNDTSDEAKRVLAYYAPYLTVHADSHSEFAQVRLPTQIMKKAMGFYDPENGNSCVERTTADYEQLADNYGRFTIHLRRMMEEIERAAHIAFARGLETASQDDFADLNEQVEQDIYTYLVRSRIIVKEFSKRIMEEFLIPAVVERTIILIRGVAWELYGR